MVVARWS